MDDERLVVALEARIRDFEKNMAKAERTGTRSYNQLQRRSRSATRRMEQDMVRSTRRMNQALATTSSRIGTFGRAFAAGAVATGVAAFTAGVGRAVDSMAQLAAEADRAGVGVEDFQEWSFVAQQNRISIDAMTDGLKEMNLRADEFVVTGAGPAAEAFQRLGLDATQLAQALEDPTDLMDQLIDRMRGLDTAARIRVADEIFGGTGGEQLVRLIDIGGVGLRRLRQEARDTGAVLEESVVQRAEEINRRFEQLRTSAQTWFRGAVVGAVDFASEIAGLRTELDEMFRSFDQARGLLGDGIVDAMTAADIAEHGDDLELTSQRYEELGDRATATAAQLTQAANLLRSYGYDETAESVARIAQEMRDLIADMRSGEVHWDQFEASLGDMTSEANRAFEAISDIDRVDFGGVIAALGGLIQRLGETAAAAATVRDSLPGGGLVGSGRGGDPRNFGGSFLDWRLAGASENAPATSPRPRSAPNDPDFGLPSTGGGGGASLSAFQAMVEETRADIRSLQAEAAALTAVAESGEDVGDAMEYARRRAELLYAAQEDGREITPELASEIDELALAFTRAGEEAQTAADRLELIQQHAERGSEAMSDLFLGILNGSRDAGDAVRALLAEIAQVQFRRAITGLAGGGGVFGTLASGLGRLLSFDGGGHTGYGTRTGGVDGKGGFPAIVHPRERIIDETRGQQMGGTAKVEIVVSMDNNGNLQAYVDGRATKISGDVAVQVNQASAAQQKRAFGSIAQENAMRGIT